MMINKYTWISIVVFICVSAISSNSQIQTCRIELNPYLTESIDLLNCKVDTLEALSIYGVDLSSINGQIAYGITGCPACVGCHCGEGFIGKEIFYSFPGYIISQAYDSLSFSDSTILKQTDFVEIYDPFAIKSNGIMSVCWVENYSPLLAGGYGDPMAGILNCQIRTDMINVFELSKVIPGHFVDRYASQIKVIQQRIVNKIDRQCWYNLLGKKMSANKR